MEDRQTEVLQGSWSIRAYLVIEGFDVSPDEITKRLEVAPTRTWRVGERKRSVSGNYDWNGWQVDSVAAPSSELSAHVHAILKSVPENLEALAGVTGDWGVTLRCVVAIRNVNDKPPMFLEPFLMQHLGRLRAGLDIDFYIETS